MLDIHSITMLIDDPTKYTYLACHSVCPLVRIGTPNPNPLSRKRVCPGTKGGGGTHSPEPVYL
jgi:hypothetical protein